MRKILWIVFTNSVVLNILYPVHVLRLVSSRMCWYHPPPQMKITTYLPTPPSYLFYFIVFIFRDPWSVILDPWSLIRLFQETSSNSLQAKRLGTESFVPWGTGGKLVCYQFLARSFGNSLLLPISFFIFQVNNQMRMMMMITCLLASVQLQPEQRVLLSVICSRRFDSSISLIILTF